MPQKVCEGYILHDGICIFAWNAPKSNILNFGSLLLFKWFFPKCPTFFGSKFLKCFIFPIFRIWFRNKFAVGFFQKTLFWNLKIILLNSNDLNKILFWLFLKNLKTKITHYSVYTDLDLVFKIFHEETDFNSRASRWQKTVDRTFITIEQHFYRMVIACW